MNRITECSSTSPGVEIMKSLTQSLFKFFIIIGEYEETSKLCLTELISSLKHTDVILLDYYKK
jgi:RsiW-degrading membrane proteinase PrsW (M82 family)